ncbi:MAG: DoxX family protein [Candidatus Paceibacterota bacterium]|jgi:uncharacterized membrane protein YphA (DoxX/SURF4 family)
MHYSSEKMKTFAPIVIRIGLALVFLWFGYQQIFSTDMWTILIPQWAVNLSGLSAYSLVLINGWFEVIFGFLLLLGIFTRISAFLLALHMLHITSVVGYNNIGVRDFGLSMAAISVFLNGVDMWSLDKLFIKNNEK